MMLSLNVSFLQPTLQVRRSTENERAFRIERGRNKAGKGIVGKLVFGPYLIDPIGFVMSRKMLRTIKRLAESSPTATPRAAASWTEKGYTPPGGRLRWSLSCYTRIKSVSFPMRENASTV